ncbi:hypothetical protein OSB04_014929 [Centaurea solstitialis]|uniref:Fatty acid desaturase domain-containing protein n=1 Tax=Centaurea solstitialis TaxID=347529 RepID=A0AA38SZL5_9ASTR|nr:hypothetical protein OSB04_014929 [Centaurea solstitialis]
MSYLIPMRHRYMHFNNHCQTYVPMKFLINTHTSIQTSNTKSYSHFFSHIEMKNMVIVCNGVNVSESQKIPFSKVIVTRKRNLFWGRKWTTTDIRVGIIIFGIHLLALFAPFTFTWDAFFVGCGRYVLCSIFGINLSYHRNLTHHSFKLPKLLEYIFAYIGVLAFRSLVSQMNMKYNNCIYQRDPIFWVSIHRYHHQYVDSEKDTHSPTFGFWYSHMGWLFDSGYISEKYKERKNVEDLNTQKFYRFLSRTYMFHTYLFTALVYAFGGFTYLVWIVGVSTVFIYHATFFVNSACHIWGNQTWDIGDLSKNNWFALKLHKRIIVDQSIISILKFCNNTLVWVALITFGEGWHNNHHAFEYSARHGLEWWQIDICWYMIRFLEAVGLATNVKLPTEAQKLKKSFVVMTKLLISETLKNEESKHYAQRNATFEQTKTTMSHHESMIMTSILRVADWDNYLTTSCKKQ